MPCWIDRRPVTSLRWPLQEPSRPHRAAHRPRSCSLLRCRFPAGCPPLVNYDALDVHLTDPNPPGASEIWYSLNQGVWERYSTPIVVDPGSILDTQAVSVDPARWIDSDIASDEYLSAPVNLELAVWFDRPSFDYVALGGALEPGSYPSPALAPPGSLTLSNSGSIPNRYLNSGTFNVYWTLDGSDPASAPTPESGDVFSGGFPGQQVALRLDEWVGDTLLVRAYARSFDTSVAISSDEVSVALGRDRLTLRRPLIEISGVASSGFDVGLRLDTDRADMPLGARIYYTTDGSDPGVDERGEPVGGTLYQGGFKLRDGGEVNARVYPPLPYRDWFVASELSTHGASPTYGNLNIALVIDESGSLDAQETAQIRAGLSAFLDAELDSGNQISLIGMSFGDRNLRSDHVVSREVTPATKPLYDAWLDGYKVQSASESDFWASGLSVAAGIRDLNLVVIIGDGVQGDLSLSGGHVDRMRAGGTHVFFVGVDPGSYHYSRSGPVTSPQIAIDSVLGSGARESTRVDASDILQADYTTRPDFSGLGQFLEGMTDALKASSAPRDTAP